jgi:hypothetical protein
MWYDKWLVRKYNNGTSGRMSFCFYPDTKEVFRPSDRDYVPAKQISPSRGSG